MSEPWLTFPMKPYEARLVAALQGGQLTERTGDALRLWREIDDGIRFAAQVCGPRKPAAPRA